MISERADGLDRLRVMRVDDGEMADPRGSRSRVQHVGRPQSRVRRRRRSVAATPRWSRRSPTSTTSRRPAPRSSSRSSRCSAATTRRRIPRRGCGRPRPTAPGYPISVVHRRDVALDGTAPALLVRLRRVRALERPGVSRGPAVAARPRLRLRDRARARRRRARPPVVRAAAGSSTRRTRSPTSSRAPRRCRERLHRARSARRARRERGRVAHGRGREPAPRSLRGDRGRGAVRRRRHDDARPELPLTVTEWEEWGDPRDPAAYARMKAYSPYDNVVGAAVSRDVRDDRAQRPAGAVLGAGEVGRQAPQPDDVGATHRAADRARGRATAAPRAATTRGATRPPCSPSCARRSASSDDDRRPADHAATADGLTLEAELADPTGGRPPHAAVVLCHPHPQYGGTMRSIVISALFEALPRSATPACGSTSAASRAAPAATPRAATSRSTSSPRSTRSRPRRRRYRSCSSPGRSAPTWRSQVADPRVAGWVAIAPPLRFRSSFPAVERRAAEASDLAEHDEYRPPADVQDEVAAWANTTTAVVAGASHFFVGRTDRVTKETLVGIDRAVR